MKRKVRQFSADEGFALPQKNYLSCLGITDDYEWQEWAQPKAHNTVLIGAIIGAQLNHQIVEFYRRKNSLENCSKVHCFVAS